MKLHPIDSQRIQESCPLAMVNAITYKPIEIKLGIAKPI
jgi:hypothetical protein